MKIEPVAAQSGTAVFEAPIDFTQADQEQPVETIEVVEFVLVADENNG